MQTLGVSPENPKDEIIERTIRTLKQGGSVIYPTDTVYGLGVNALDERAVRRLFKIKERPPKKAVPIIVRDIEMAKKVAFFDKKKEKILRAVWPGQVTVVLPKREILPAVLTGGEWTVGTRIPDYRFTEILMEKLEFPITTTSANISGNPPSGNIDEVLEQFKSKALKPDLVLDVGNLPESKPSTVLDLTSSRAKILRIGPVSKEELLKILKI